ncbi:MAG: NAD-dependent epimerase [Spirochaetales bacterium]|nr:NAD-dependent epimerase [Spirochaetales bacterium]
MKVLITGTAGFIGFHLARQMIQEGHQIVGLDSINDYYDVRLKMDRLREAGMDPDALRAGKLTGDGPYRFIQLDLTDRQTLQSLFEKEAFDTVIHLAAQAGVRYSLINPHAYMDSNISGFMNILECCRHGRIKHLVYASSSSVYGLNTHMPFSTRDSVDHPVSLYAASKKANELMAHTYSHLFGLPTTGLRFFTVYGPWGRPDMALFIFVQKILAGETISVFNSGQMKRDFTFIDDIVTGIIKVHDHIPEGRQDHDPLDPSRSSAPYRIYNIGRNQPVDLMDFVRAIEKAVGKEAKINFEPMQPGDVAATWADCSDLTRDTGYRPTTEITSGIPAFVKWYREYYDSREKSDRKQING